MITAHDVIDDLEKFVFKEVLQDHSEKTAMSCSIALVECLYLNFKNQLMYIPTSNKDDQEKRYQNIFNDFSGNNHKDLAIKYKLSLPSIYKITNSQRRKYINKIQVDLFPIDDVSTNKPITLLVTQTYLPNEFIKCGISNIEANKLSEKVTNYLLYKYPGIAICISKKFLKQKTSKTQLSLF